MMGTKERSFAPLVNGSVEDLVPADHFYRHLERTFDLSFVRELVHETYASKGRPSIDPVVFFSCFRARLSGEIPFKPCKVEGFVSGSSMVEPM
jgi:hypothetical protein